MRTRTLLATALCACALFAVRAARANPEPTSHNARSLGMGGVGTSLVGDGAAVFHNPAGLDDVEHYTLSGSFTPVLVSNRAPWAGPGTETRSQLLFGPLVELGGGIRLNPWFVIGLGAYAATGFGNTYDDVPTLGGGDVDVSANSAELSLPLVFHLLEGLSVGVAPRLAVARLTSSTLTPMAGASPEPALVRSEASMWGATPLGVQIGVRYRLHPVLRIGLNYRSAMSVELSGTTRTLGMTFDSETEYDTPHSFRFGLDASLLDERLILAADARYMLYSLSNETVTTTLEIGGMRMETIAVLDWKDSFGVMFGAEYLVTPSFPVRLGYNLTPSATPEATASPFMPIPAITHGFSIGAGLRPEHFDVDFAALYSTARTDIASGPTAGAYETEAVLLSVSVTYHR